MNRYQKSLDKNHSDICESLQKCGVNVTDLSGNGSGIPDILTWFQGQICFIEIKHGEKAELKRSQLEFMAYAPMFSHVAENFEQALRLAKRPSEFALTGAEKLRLRQFLVRWTGERLHLPTFYKVIRGEKV